jgi:hypothetical protein
LTWLSKPSGCLQIHGPVFFVRWLSRQRRGALAVPAIEKLPRIEVKFATDPNNYCLRARRVTRRVRGTARNTGLEHRIGGIEKQNITGRTTIPKTIPDGVCVRRKSIARSRHSAGEVFGVNRAAGIGMGLDVRFNHFRGRADAQRGKVSFSAHRAQSIPGNLGEGFRISKP